MTSVPYKSTTTAPTRICRYCNQHRPINDFRKRISDSNRRMYQCRHCHNQAERLRRQCNNGRLAQQQFHKHLTNLKNEQAASGVERIYLNMCTHFGGTEGLLRLWIEAMEKDMTEGGLKAFRHIAAILRLMEYYESVHLNKHDYSQMSDEELLDAFSQHLCD